MTDEPVLWPKLYSEVTRRVSQILVHELPRLLIRHGAVVDVGHRRRV
jgi:hypothetical protein